MASCRCPGWSRQRSRSRSRSWCRPFFVQPPTGRGHDAARRPGCGGHRGQGPQPVRRRRGCRGCRRAPAAGSPRAPLAGGADGPALVHRVAATPRPRADAPASRVEGTSGTLTSALGARTRRLLDASNATSRSGCHRRIAPPKTIGDHTAVTAMTARSPRCRSPACSSWKTNPVSAAHGAQPWP